MRHHSANLIRRSSRIIPNQIPTDNLLSHWAFTEGSGYTIHDTGSCAHNLVDGNQAGTWIAGKENGYGYRLTGVQLFTTSSTGYPSGQNAPITLSTFVKFYTIINTYNIMSWCWGDARSSLIFGVISTTKKIVAGINGIYDLYNGSSGLGNTITTPSDWIHLCFVYDPAHTIYANRMNVFINGENILTDNDYFPFVIVNGIGIKIGQLYQVVDAAVSATRVYGRPLTLAEVNAIAHSP